MTAEDANGVRINPAPSICSRPDPSESAGDTFEKVTNSLTRHGRTWVRVTALGANGYPLACEVVSEQRVTWQLDDTNTRLAAVAIDGRPQDVRMIRLIPFILEAENVMGASPLVLIREALDQLAAAYQFSATYYSTTAATPPYALVSPTRLQTDKAQELLTAWTEARDKSRPAVISGNLELKTFSVQSAADALVLDAIAQLDAVVARVLHVPPSMVNVLSQGSLTYNTSADQARAFLVQLENAYLKRIESAWSTFLPRGQSAKFRTEALTRMSPKEQLDYDIAAIAAGVRTVDEIRAERGLAPNDTRTAALAPVNV